MGFTNICSHSRHLTFSHLLLHPFNKSLIHDVKTFFSSVDKVHVTAFSGFVIFLILTLCCALLLCCYCCPHQIKCCTRPCIDSNNKRNRLVIHERAIKERSQYKVLMRTVGHPEDRADDTAPEECPPVPPKLKSQHSTSPD